MKSAANKPGKAHSTSITRGDGFFSTARSPGFFSPVMRKAGPAPPVQTKLSVSKPSDPLEKEADRNADKVMRMPAEQVQRAETKADPAQVQRTAAAGQQVQRFGEGTPTVAANAGTEIARATTGGQPLPSDVRGFMEPRLNADLGDVRVHADESAAGLSNHLSARAFTHRNHVFFARDQFQPGTDTGRRLLAHELTHTIQQGATIQRSTEPAASVTTKSSTPAVQRLGLRDALDYFADKAYFIPGFRMLTLIIGFNPINMRSTPRTAANFLRALIELVPGGALITQVLDNHGVINKAAEWVEQKVATLGDIGSDIVGGLKRFLDSLSWRDIFNLGGVWDRAKRIFTEPIDRLVSFGVGVVTELLGMVKQVILRPLAALAQGTDGYDLLKAILGQDPITGDPVPRTADTLIGGFMRMIGQQEVWQNIKKGNAVGRAFAWFQGALAGLMGFIRSIPGRIVATLKSLTFLDVVTVAGAFKKVGSAFVGLAVEFGAWAVKQVLSLLEILFSVVAPGVMPYIAKAKSAFQTILRNPIAFVGNLVRAGKLGFEMFATNILSHLKAALIKWLVGPLADAGVYIPKSFDLLEIIKLVLSVLGLTWSAIRAKLVKIIPDPVLAGLEKTAGVLVTLVTQGPAAAWEQIKAELTELKDQLISQVSSMIQGEVVKAAVKKLVTMLNPAGAVIQAIIAIYDTVTFFIEKAKQIGAVVASFIDSISAIAAGVVGPAAKRVEQTLANTLVVVVGFLAKFAGLGGIPDKLVGIVKKIRHPIDKGLDKIVAWLGKMLDKLVATAKDTAKKLLEWWKKKVPISGGDEPHTLTFTGEYRSAKLVVMSAPERPSDFVRREANIAGKDQQDDVKKDITDTENSERSVFELQKKLGDVDGSGTEKAKTAASGDQRTAAGRLSGELNIALIGLAKIIGGAMAKFGKGADEKIPEFELERSGNFRQKLEIAKAYLVWRATLKQSEPESHHDRVELDSKGRPTTRVSADTARRHIVSSDDMSKHYSGRLSGKTVSQAKLLMEQSGSIAHARVPVGPENKGKKQKIGWKMIVAAATERYKRFFSYIPNLFLGDRDVNSKIGKHLDNRKPGMAEIELNDHVAMIKRQWALDGSFTPTPVKRE